MNIIFLGPPGSGKGTYASRIGPKMGIPHISTGDIFRQSVKEGTPLGKKVDAVMKSGKLVPDSLVLDVVKERITKPDCVKGYIFDGFPRTVRQAEAFDKMSKVDAVVNVVVPDEWVIKRMTSRTTCRKCGKIYNTLFLKPKKEGVCDQCGGELYIRDDAKEEVIKVRLEEYKKLTEPLIKYYREKGILMDLKTPTIDAPIDAIVGQIMGMLEG